MRIDPVLEKKVRDVLASAIEDDGPTFLQGLDDLYRIGFRAVNALTLPVLAAAIDELVGELSENDRSPLIRSLIDEISTSTHGWLGYTWPRDVVSDVVYYAARISPEVPIPADDRLTAEALVLSTTLLCAAVALSKGPRSWNRQLDLVEDSLEAAS